MMSYSQFVKTNPKIVELDPINLPSDLFISTMTLTCKMPLKFDTTMIAKNLPLSSNFIQTVMCGNDNEICRSLIPIKKKTCRTTKKRKSVFNNKISLILNDDDNFKLNIKISKNGLVQLTTNIYKICKMLIPFPQKMLKLMEKQGKYYNQITLIFNNNEHTLNIKLFENGSVEHTHTDNINKRLCTNKTIRSNMKIKKVYNRIIMIFNNNDKFKVNIKLFKNGLIQMATLKEFSDDIKYLKRKNINKLIGTIKKRTRNTNKLSITINDKSKRELILSNDGRVIQTDNKIKFLTQFKGQSDLPNKKQKRNFYNQVTIILNNNDNMKANVKLFKNGALQLTGCKSISPVIWGLSLLFEMLKKPIDGKYYAEPYIFIDIKNITDMRIAMINSNFIIGFEINREKLFEILTNDEIECSYDSSRHAGVNIRYETKINKTSIFVFDTGSIIITGAKTYKQLVDCYKFINMYLISNIDKICM